MPLDNDDSIEESVDAELNEGPHKLFEIGPLERLVSGGLRACIKAHGPIDRKWIGSAAKRIAQSIRGSLVQYAGQTATDIAFEQYKVELAEENLRMAETILSLRKQRDDLLEKLRNGDTL